MATSPEPRVAGRQTDHEIGSPGPLHMSDLNMSPPGQLAPLPRRLEPINPVKKKRKRAKKRDPSIPDNDAVMPPDSLLGDGLRSQLRSRLDPIYNPTPPSQVSEDVPAAIPAVATDDEKVENRARRKKKRESKRQNERSEKDETEVKGQNNEETLCELHGQDEMTVVRELPDLPSDTEGIPNTPTVAEQMASGQDLVTTHQHNLQLYLSDEDVVDEGAEDHTTHTFTLTRPHTHTTHNNEVIFVERKDGRGFVAQKKGQTKSFKQGEWAWLTWTEGDITTGQVTTFIHRMIQRLAITAHGLLAGLALWDCIVTNVIASQGAGHVGLLMIYNSLTLPLHAVYLFLISLLTVSLCDRLDFAHIDRQCLRNFCRPPSQLFVLCALVLVSLALVLTVSVAAIDERISLFTVQPSLWLDILDPVNTSLSPLPSPTTHTMDELVYVAGSTLQSGLVGSWLAVGVTRAVLCCGSWVMAIWISNTDRLEGYLQSMSEETSKVR